MIGEQKNGPSRRGFLKTAAISSAVAPIILRTANGFGSKKERNIIFILSDDHRYDALSYLNHPIAQTPHMDSLLRNGIHYKNAFVTTSLCSPSRASILTGLYAHRHGVLDNSTLIPRGTMTFPLALQKAGYKTGFIGKWHMGGSNDNPRPGFDRWVSLRGQGEWFNPRFNIDGKHQRPEGYISDLITEFSLNFLRENKNRPIFLFMSHKAIHENFTPAPRHKGKFKNVTMPRPITFPDTDDNYKDKPDLDDESPVAALFNFACHSTSLGAKNLLITGDIFGVAESFVEDILGPDITAPVFVGASGNINPHCNGGSGYLAHAELYKEGGYEIKTSPFDLKAAEIVEKQMLKMLYSMYD